MEPVKLGSLLQGGEQRDAVHIAVAPVVAAEFDLRPGMLIGFTEPGSENVRARHDGIGIVDPYLKEAPKKGERFWMFLLPNTVTSLRHEWTHPNFPVPVVASSPPVSMDTVAESRLWIEGFAERIDQTYSRLMRAAQNWVGSEGYSYEYDNSERYKDHWDEFPEFWKHYEIVTGEKVSEEEKRSFFRCSC